MPDQPFHLPHAHRLYRIYAVVDAVALLKVDGVLGNFISDKKNDLFIYKQWPHIQTLEMGAKHPPVGVMQINVVLPANILASAHIVH